LWLLELTLENIEVNSVVVGLGRNGSLGFSVPDHNISITRKG
jgi:hypothetical protein